MLSPGEVLRGVLDHFQGIEAALGGFSGGRLSDALEHLREAKELVTEHLEAEEIRDRAARTLEPLERELDEAVSRAKELLGDEVVGE